MEIKLIDKKSKKVILTDIKIADNFYSRLIGLLGKSSLDRGQGLIIKPCKSVHSFFMRFPIDVAFIDKHNKICFLMNSMQVNKISPFVITASYVIEAPSGTFKSTKVRIGDEVVLEYERLN